MSEIFSARKKLLSVDGDVEAGAVVPARLRLFDHPFDGDGMIARFSFDGQTVRYRNTAPELVRKGVGFVPQTENVFPRLTIEENLQMGLFNDPKRFGERFDRHQRKRALADPGGAKNAQTRTERRRGPCKRQRARAQEPRYAHYTLPHLQHFAMRSGQRQPGTNARLQAFLG